ncbi:MAG: methyltransferase domain-containing protein [Steroidobacteraceae bacterium]
MVERPGIGGSKRTAFQARFDAKPEIQGKVTLLNFGSNSAPLPANHFDFVLVARWMHAWVGDDALADKVFQELYGTLKSGGILAVEQHRANPGTTDISSGYVTEDHVIKPAIRAGFKLAGRSEINANPADTKDHPFGVWTLPPTSVTRPYGLNEHAFYNARRSHQSLGYQTPDAVYFAGLASTERQAA